MKVVPSIVRELVQLYGATWTTPLPVHAGALASAATAVTSKPMGTMNMAAAIAGASFLIRRPTTRIPCVGSLCMIAPSASATSVSRRGPAH